MTLDLFPLGWTHYLVGGLLIGLGVSLLYVLTGSIGGMSSVFSSSWTYLSNRPFFAKLRQRNDRSWRLVYALGLVVGAAAWWWWLGPSERMQTSVPLWQLGLGGVLVGFGARLSNGCTSGHGICGLGSLQPNALYAVITFMVTGFLTANLVLHLGAN